ncbi:MAG TPA: cation transporter [bacterium]|nr:cation transporter [bacterium]
MSNDIVILSVEGLHQAPAAARLERALAGVRGVQGVSLNLATEKMRVTHDPAAADLRRLVEVVRSVGCDVRASHAVIGVDNIGCPSCATRIEDALRGVGGVLDAAVDLPTRRAIVSYLPGHVTQRDLAQAIREAGYQPTRAPAGAEPGRLTGVGAFAR